MKTYSLKDCLNNPIDYKLDKLFNKENGFYIELGARQSGSPLRYHTEWSERFGGVIFAVHPKY